jgi:DNA ligase-1
MRRFAQICEAVAATTKKTEKVRLAADYLRSLTVEDAACAALFFTGRPFPRIEERVLGVGGSLVWQALARLARPEAGAFEAVYRKHGDLGAMSEEVLEGNQAAEALSLEDVRMAFERLAARRGASQKLPELEALLRRACPREAKYIVKIITGDLRIGLKESLVEEAIAQAFARALPDVERANMLTGDISATLRLAAAGRLDAAQLRLFNPIGFMLASPAESAEEAMEYFPEGAFVEDKYDGIRAQAHKRGPEARFFSRTLDEVREFPELLPPLEALPGEFILDGEIVGWRGGRALPFTDFQTRLGRRRSEAQGELWSGHPIDDADVPVVYVVFDLLYGDGKLLVDAPLSERRRRLEILLADVVSAGGPRDEARDGSKLQLARASLCHTGGDLQLAFEGALARGNEGVMVKAPDSLYAPGRRGRYWLKLKRPMATLDVVVTAVEYGHGKRRGLLSDYTFSVRVPGEDRLVTIGKAYSGLTDAEILELTEYFKQHTLEDRGFSRRVEPTIVMEVAFNNIQRSERHESGYALRFPRIVRLRPDKPVSEIDTLDRVKQLYRGSLITDSGP